MNAHDYASKNAELFRQQLYDWLRIPSVSTDPERTGDMRQAADWVAAEMQRVGFTRAEVLPTAGHPVVYGEWLGAGADAPTVLVYGHYDVQPAELEAGWTSDPFEPIERDGKIYARGASDDKGQAFAQLKAAESLLASGGASVNLKFLIEGEEEIGSPNLGAWVKANRDLLKADVCVISDTSILALDQPSICYSVRGLAYMEVEVWGPKQDLHSGGFGGIVHNPAQALAEIIAQLHNADGSVAVPSFYDDVLSLRDEERAELQKSASPEDFWLKMTGVPQFWGEAAFALHERIGARPTLEVNGFASGFYGEGSKTVLPAKALAKISCRLVANQKPRHIFELVRDYIAFITPPTVRSEVRLIAEADPALTDLQSPAVQAAIRAYEQGWGRPPLFERGGGSLPIMADLQRELEVPVVLLGFGLPSDGAHGPDESFHIEMFHKGIDTAIYFLEALALE
ncbi:MAG TPA: dipeptidase [Phototrophicaceae bacterium]|nr:dipeptidase [Phototrophicaceae bacterium]